MSSKKQRKKRTNFRRREYTEAERLAVLDALKTNGGNATLTAEQTGVPANTVRAWGNGFRHARTLQLYEASGGNLAHTAEHIAWEIAGVMPDRIHDAPLNHLATAFGTMVDKMRLLRDQPTNIVDKTNTNKDDGTEQFKELLRGMTLDEREQLRTIVQRVRERTESRQLGSGD